MTNNKFVLIAAGGTGGHIYPAIEFATKLKKQGYSIIWFSNKGYLAEKILSKYNYDCFFYRILPFSGKSIWSKVKALWLFLLTTIKAYMIIRKKEIIFSLGFGGYASSYALFASKLKKIPIYIHEQNSTLGMVNHYFSKAARFVFTGLPLNSSNKKFIFTGNPIAKKFFSVGAEISNTNSKKFKILVVGGSQGSRAFNRLLPPLLAKLKNVEIIHQTGIKDYQQTKKYYSQYNIKAEVIAYIDSMPEAYSNATIVIARAGAMTITEILATRSASILIPLPSSAKNHQVLNARYLSERQAAILLEQKKINLIVDIINNLQQNLSKVLSLKSYAKSLVLPQNSVELAIKHINDDLEIGNNDY